MKNNQTGFTLLEALITVAIIGIIAAVAMPSYNEYIVKVHRSEGPALLREAAYKQETHAFNHNVYATTMITSGSETSTAIVLPAMSPNGYYALTLTGTATTFTVTATPQTGHTDPLCGTLTLDNLGVKTASGTGTVQDCWE